MNEQLLGFIDEILRSHYGPRLEKSPPRMRRMQVEKLLTDDGQRRLGQAERAAVEWGGNELHDDVRIVSERMIVTPLGMVYAAGIRGLHPRREHAARSDGPGDETVVYLATPRSSYDSLIDHTRGAVQRRRSMAAVDSRYGRELEFPWPLDAGLRRTFDDHDVLVWI